MFRSRKLLNTVLLTLASVVSVSTYAQTTTSTPTDRAAATAADPQPAVFLAGPGDVKPGTRGALRLTAKDLYFESAAAHASVPISQIASVSKGDERAERGGTAGIVARLYDYQGTKEVLGLAMQKKVDLLSLEYHDELGGLHGAVFVLPSDKAGDLQERLSAKLLSPALPQAVPCSVDQVKPNSILLDPIEAKGIDVPAEYRLLLYERLLSELRSRLPEYKVYRADDSAAGPGCMSLSLEIDIAGFKKGNQVLRASTNLMGMFVGLTSISYQVHLRDSNGVEVGALGKTLKQSSRGDKESLDLTHSIAKNVAKQISKAISPVPGKNGQMAGTTGL
jgi:hypothetical protein